MTSNTPTQAPTPADVHLCDAGLARAFDFLGKRWNGVILGTLSKGPAGFADLRRGVGAITDSVLSDRLNELMRAGLVLRCVTDTRPPGVSYSLSPSGLDLLPVLDELATWASKHLSDKDC
ncbi:helix-turn-helix transcriptional regulator [Jatrophihabitans telluris]|uniref:Helix-turn-helix transcriptional regulator n=1 Tax=Jatrophihabitans telluris TaxID=2038343 RepID=A0ABY4QW65_9ACTN|nr:helix-turn-helix domain-containing protein [Jatrophihabitans telluris]UQX87342.1 helix-turn-helix transcriptional regulator [Jatrophihabitans telluris]